MNNKKSEWYSLPVMLFFLIFPCCRAEIPDDGNGDGPDSIKLLALAEIRNQMIGRGINFGNALEAPNEGDWGLVIKESYIQAVKDAGFSSVRLPICWSAHTGSTAPYPIDPQSTPNIYRPYRPDRPTCQYQWIWSWAMNSNFFVHPGQTD